jgi:ribosomal protein S12 methylthiotransferase
VVEVSVASHDPSVVSRDVSVAPTIGFITLGCAKNEADTDHMGALLTNAGFHLAHVQLMGSLDEGERDEVAEVVRSSDVVAVNTCSFLTSASEEAIAVIFDVLSQHDFVPGHTRLVVTGCLPARYGDQLEDELPEVDAFVPVDQEDNIVEIMQRVCGLSDAQMSAVGEVVAKPTRLRMTEEPWAYVKISDGCDRFCSFCAIPFIRGRYNSRTFAEIDAEIAELVSRGVSEIVLIGQDTGIWGRDLSVLDAEAEVSDLAGMLDVLARKYPVTWFRVMYLQPEGITDDLLATLARHDTICSYLDIPLQHASARVIREMNRRGDGPTYLALLERIRERVPDVTLRSTFITGFPGESEDDFDELLDFVEAASFDYAGVFAFSAEEGTAAGERTDQVAGDVRATRARVLQDHAERMGHARALAMRSTVAEVLMCGYDEDRDCWYGRSQAQAPDVDGVIYVRDADESHKGRRVAVNIDEVYGFEMEGALA